MDPRADDTQEALPFQRIEHLAAFRMLRDDARFVELFEMFAQRGPTDQEAGMNLAAREGLFPRIQIAQDFTACPMRDRFKYRIKISH